MKILCYSQLSNNIIMAINDILNTYIPLRASITNNDNGKVKLGCVAFSPKLNHQCVLRLRT